MFRSAAVQTLRRAHQLNNLNSSRSLVTAAQKRALNNEQIAGKETTTSTTKAADVKPPTSSSSSGGSVPPSGASQSGGSSGGGGGGGGSPIVPIVGGIAVATGIGYYMGLIPMGKTEEKEEAPVALAAKEEKKEVAVVKKDEVKEKETKPIEASDTPVEVKKKEEEKKVEKKKTTGNRVINISAPPTTGRTSEPVASVEHDPNGSRVSVAKFSQVISNSEEQPTVVETTSTTTSTNTLEETSVPSLSSIAAAESELTSVTSTKIDDALTKAHISMRSTLDETFLKDLDKLNENQLRIRIAQLATEIGERTKWEAVRLREFLSMKEKEVADK